MKRALKNDNGTRREVKEHKRVNASNGTSKSNTSEKGSLRTSSFDIGNKMISTEHPQRRAQNTMNKE